MIKFKKPVQAYGRAGAILQTGIIIARHEIFPTVRLTPVIRKDTHSLSCSIDLPLDQLEEIIVSLQDIHEQYKTVKQDEKERRLQEAVV